MAFSIFESDSFDNSAGDFASAKSRAEAGSVTSSRVRRLMMQLMRTANGSFFLAMDRDAWGSVTFNGFFQFLYHLCNVKMTFFSRHMSSF